MANNRMFLVCKICGRGIVIAKVMTGPWYIALDHRKTNAFFDIHQDHESSEAEDYELLYELSMSRDQWIRCTDAE